MTAREHPKICPAKTRPAKVCLATATTERYVPGTLVLIGSFLRRHPGFAGDIVVVHDAGLPESLREVLADVFDGVRFHPVSPELVDRAKSVQAALPQRDFTPERLFALEAFRLGGYRKVLFCDSDLLFRAPVDALFDAPHALLCCGDKRIWRAATGMPPPSCPCSRAGRIPAASFSARSTAASCCSTGRLRAMSATRTCWPWCRRRPGPAPPPGIRISSC